jgi:hypothetical protein
MPICSVPVLFAIARDQVMCREQDYGRAGLDDCRVTPETGLLPHPLLNAGCGRFTIAFGTVEVTHHCDIFRDGHWRHFFEPAKPIL